MEDDPPSALIIVFDMTQAGWERSAQANGPSAVEAAESLLTFVRAFFLLHGGNSVVVIATHPHGSEYLYQSPVHAASGAEVTGVLLKVSTTTTRPSTQSFPTLCSFFDPTAPDVLQCPFFVVASPPIPCFLSCFNCR